MFARITRLSLRPGSRTGYTQSINDEIFPAMKKLAGFAGQISMVSSDGKEGMGISLWHRREDAEAYHRTRYVDSMKVLEKFTEGIPELHTYEVTNSTVEFLQVRKAA